MLTQTNTLELVDLDGTTNTLDIKKVLEENIEGEILAYLRAAGEFVARGIWPEQGEPSDGFKCEVFDGIKEAILTEVYPNRARLKYWGTFPMGDDIVLPVTPAVDHMQVTKPAVTLYLNQRLATEEDGSPLARRITEFLSTSWGFGMFKHASAESLPHTHIEDSAAAAIEERIRRNALIAIFTNSSPEKAVKMLTGAGFGDRIVEASVKRGGIGAIGNGKKWLVDTNQPEALVDLSEYYSPDRILLDIRREAYRVAVEELMTAHGADKVAMFTDIPELDSYPLRAWYGDRALLGMKTNPMSAEESINAAIGILKAAVDSNLGRLMNQLL
jgi:hypothetical protein